MEVGHSRVHTEQVEQNQAIIGQFFQHFNERRFDAAANLFKDDAILEHVPTRRHQRGGDGFLEFAEMWVRAFPDAALTVERVSSHDGVTTEVDLLARGTHLGALDMGAAGIFKPTGVSATLRLRQLLEIRDGKVTFSSLSFDLQDIVHQLVTVDVAKLLEQLQKIQQVGVKVAAAPANDAVERRNLIARLGAELDTARHIVRPYFRR
ncbi:MAG: ester cyclase [Vicinamibacterales bacterium]